ncbi:hypothetical protein E2C01_026220 [Portunus trituberculatus]|uniref:Uncharacterized protein n=1 Tax=Portunus trituberculatus TaxID=210409 RepID=A0A5B7EI79_PORTR|nr:hypothetical protein [Portunus trituberculatus]
MLIRRMKGYSELLTRYTSTTFKRLWDTPILHPSKHSIPNFRMTSYNRQPRPRLTYRVSHELRGHEDQADEGDDGEALHDVQEVASLRVCDKTHRSFFLFSLTNTYIVCSVVLVANVSTERDGGAAAAHVLWRAQVGGGSRSARRAAVVQHTRGHVCQARGGPPTFYNGARVATELATSVRHLPLSLWCYNSDPPFGIEQPQSSHLPRTVESVRRDSCPRHHDQLHRSAGIKPYTPHKSTPLLTAASVHGGIGEKGAQSSSSPHEATSDKDHTKLILDMKSRSLHVPPPPPPSIPTCRPATQMSSGQDDPVATSPFSYPR